MGNSGLLAFLGLTVPKGVAPVGGTKGGPNGPTGPLRAPGYTPQEEVPTAKRKGLDDTAIAKAIKDLPTDPPKRAEALADLVTKVSDAARRDPIVRALRDVIAKIQPIMSDKDAKKKIDKAINDLVEKGVKEGLMELLKLVVGKEPTKVDRDGPRQDGPNMPEKDLGEHILKTPPIDLPFDKPPKLKVLRFRIDVAKTLKPSKYFNFTLTTPDGFKVDDSKTGAAWVVIAAKDDYEKSGGHPRRVRDVHITQKGKFQLSLAAPDDPGPYVIFVMVGPGPEESSREDIEIKN